MSQQVTKKQKKKEAEISLGNESTMTKCPYCLNSAPSIVEFKNGYLSYVSCFLILLIFGFIPSLLLVPFMMIITKSLIHRCLVCGEEIGTDGKIFYSLYLKDKIMSFKVGEMGCILTRKILLGFFLLMVTISLLVYRIHNLPEKSLQLQGYHHHYEPNIVVDDTWEDFLQDCARKEYLLQSDKRLKCQSKYTDRTIQDWKGYVIRVDDYRQSFLKFIHHAVTIIVRMDPADGEFFPDIVLTLDSEYAEKLGDVVEQLHRGSEFSFNATIKNFGDESNIRHFHLKQIRKEEGFRDIPAHLNDNGRYADSQGFLKLGG